jgi:hypothetical protein
VPLEEPLPDEARLLGDVRQRDDRGKGAGGPRRGQLLGELPKVVRDRRVGERQDLRRRSVVARQPVGRRAGIPLREAEDVLERRAAEGVDRLRVVADHGDVSSELPHPVHDLALELVGVLVLVHEHVLVGALELLGRVGRFLQQALPGQQQIVVVAGVGDPLPLAVPLEDREDVRLQLQEVRRALGQDLGERPGGVDRVGVEVEQHVSFREAPLDDRDLPVRGRRLEELAGVFLVEDREVRSDPDPRPEPPQDPVADGVESAPHQAPGIHRQERLDPPQHLPGGLVGEGQEHDPPRVGSGFDQAGNPVDQRPGLPGPGPRDDQDRPAAGHHDLPLLLVQLPVVVHPVGLRPGGGFQDVTPFHQRSLPAR